MFPRLTVLKSPAAASNSKAEKILATALRKVGWKKLPDRAVSGAELDVIVGPKRPLRRSRGTATYVEG